MASISLAQALHDPQPRNRSSSSKKPLAKDMSHHISRVSAARFESPLKALYPYYQVPGMVICAGGIPSPTMFPFQQLQAEVMSPAHFRTDTQTMVQPKKGWFSALFGSSAPAPPKDTSISIPKWSESSDPTAYQLSAGLQYTTANGVPALSKWCRDFTELVYRPGYSNWTTVLNSGNTDAWDKIALALCDPGETIMAEEATYPAATAAVLPHGIKVHAVAMDGQGMLPDALEAYLESWDEAKEGARRPHLIYTVPVCQNPTGATASAARKQAIYNVCCKYDVIICEDDPYYYLQAGDYSLARHRHNNTGKEDVESDEDFIRSLVPSYLTFDTEGRVLRIESFSKTLCPGSRLGWVVGHPQFINRYERAVEGSTNFPSGFSQMMLGKLLSDEWGTSGYLRWLKGVKAIYRARRNDFVDLLLSQPGAEVETRLSVEGAFEFTVAPHVARSPLAGLEYNRRVLFSFVPPAGGMFVWLRVHFSNHPDFPRKSPQELSVALWKTMAERKVLVALGSLFTSELMPDASMRVDAQQIHVAENGDGFYRLAFSAMDYESMALATKTIASSTIEFFGSAAVQS